LHNKELYNLRSSPNTMRIITSRKMRLVEYVASRRETKKYTQFCKIGASHGIGYEGHCHLGCGVM
jgi:hypothetical protein